MNICCKIRIFDGGGPEATYYEHSGESKIDVGLGEGDDSETQVDSKSLHARKSLASFPKWRHHLIQKTTSRRVG